MKLHNKKTGENWDIGKIITNEYPSWDTLKQINEDWEDVDGTNDTNTPLIKDEKIRKAVKAWAEANEIEFLDIASDSRLKDCGGNYIEFLCLPFKELPKKSYYIAELCGEEEEE